VPRSVVVALLVLAFAFVAGCADSPVVTGSMPAAAPAPAPRVRATRPPAICGALRVRTLGKVASPEATELSGLVASAAQPGVLWTHNDSGDRARVFAVKADGSVVADLDVPGAQAVDWEDIALARGKLWLGDIGDNAEARDGIDVYVVPEPDVPASGSTASATRLALRYPDGAHNAETLLVNPLTGRELAIVTKDISGRSGVYVARAPAWRLRRVGALALSFGSLTTGGDVSADGRIVVVRTYTGIVVWVKRPGASLAATLRRAPTCRGRIDLGGEGQGEAIALSRHGRAFFTVAEGASPPVRRYAP
jgi:hypothetical protein